MDSVQKEESTLLKPEQIEECIAILNALNADTNQIFEIPKEKRLALIKAAVTSQCSDSCSGFRFNI